MTRRNLTIALILIAGILPVIISIVLYDELSSQAAHGTIREISLFDQSLVVITAFVVKPLYMLISLAIFWVLRNSDAEELFPLRWGLLAFFIGELFCSINYLIFQDRSILSEYLHNYGMVVAFGFIGYSLFEGLDKHVIQYSHPSKRCSFVNLCSECIKNQEVRCRVRQLFQLMLLVLGLLVFIPLLAEIHETSYLTTIFGTQYNYVRMRIHLLFEIRYCPVLALVLFVVSFISMNKSRDKQIPDLARITFSAGIGALGFGIFRLFFNSVFIQNLSRAASWEEITEFILMVTIAYVLWIFQKRLKLFAG